MRRVDLIIDLFSPVVPAGLAHQWRRVVSRPLQVDALGSVPELSDLKGYFAKMDELGDYRQVVALPPSVASALTAAKDSGKSIEACNEALAALCRKHPERFPGFCAVLPTDSARDMADEALRSITDLGACAVQLDPRILRDDTPLAPFDALFEILVRADLPLYLPAGDGRQTETEAEERLASQTWQAALGPAKAQARQFTESVLRHPGLTICVDHGGHLVRLGTVHTSLDGPQADACALHFDARAFSTARCLLSSNGPAQIALAIQSVKAQHLSEHEQRQVLSNAASGLLKLEELTL